MAIVGVSDHAGWAVLMTVEGTAVVDRRRVALLDDGLPALPHHHECQALPTDEAIALIDRVRTSAERHARAALGALPEAITGMALRRCPPLPPTIPERIASYRAQCVADSVMYREVLAAAARERGWAVAWYDAKQVLADPSIGELLRTTGAALGPPWRVDHRLAMAAAIAAGAAASAPRATRSASSRARAPRARGRRAARSRR